MTGELTSYTTFTGVCWKISHSFPSVWICIATLLTFGLSFTEIVFTHSCVFALHLPVKHLISKHTYYGHICIYRETLCTFFPQQNLHNEANSVSCSARTVKKITEGGKPSQMHKNLLPNCCAILYNKINNLTIWNFTCAWHCKQTSGFSLQIYIVFSQYS